MLKKTMSINSVRWAKEDDIHNYMRFQLVRGHLVAMSKKRDFDDEHIKVLFQPVKNVRTQTFTTAEALSRFVIPETGKIISPVEYIPIAEENGFIHLISLIVLNKTCKAIRNLLNEGYDITRISVNFAIEEFEKENFCEDILKIIAENDIPYHMIAIEVTESQSNHDTKMIMSVMDQLKERGIKLYLDDFGTGYSNLERIVQLPIDIVKFDRSLTILSAKDEKSRQLVGRFSDIFKAFNYSVLYEGVEDIEDEKRCIELQADYLQGFKYSKPVEYGEFVKFLEKIE